MKKSIVSKIKQFEYTDSQKFNEITKIHNVKELYNLSEKKWPKEWKDVYYKGYPRFNAASLPKPYLSRNISIVDILMNRKSARNFLGKPIELVKLSTLLYYSVGLNRDKKGLIHNRFYPSAGGRFPLEVYPIAFNVDNLERGIYHYYLKSHCLEELPIKKDFQKKACIFFGNQKWVEKTSLLLVITAVFNRNQIKYGDRGYRHVLAEVGSIIQNVYLISAALDLGCCPTGGYVDDGYNELLDLDGLEESVVGVIAIGNPK